MFIGVLYWYDVPGRTYRFALNKNLKMRTKYKLRWHMMNKPETFHFKTVDDFNQRPPKDLY